MQYVIIIVYNLTVVQFVHLEIGKKEKSMFKEITLGFHKFYLISTPTKRFVCAGRVPIWLAWERKDGERLTPEDVEKIKYSSVPALLGYKTRSWETEQGFYDTIRDQDE